MIWFFLAFLVLVVMNLVMACRAFEDGMREDRRRCW